MNKPLVGVVGLGAMGAAIALRLNEIGFPVFGWDISPGARSRMSDAGVPCDEPARLRECEVIVTSLPDDAAVTGALIPSPEDGGIFTVLQRGTAVVEMSTILPVTIRRVNDIGASLGIRVVDCPVSGSPVDARNGRLNLLIGFEGTFGIEESILHALGKLNRVGPVGAGKVIKLVNNVMSMGCVALVAEGLRLADMQGIDLLTAIDVIGDCNGSSRQLQLRGHRMRTGDLKAGFAIKLAAKDMRLAEALADDTDLSLPVTAVVRKMLECMVDGEMGEQDVAAVILKYGAPLESWGEPEGSSLT